LYPESEHSLILKFEKPPGLGLGLKNFGTGAESESEKVTPATFDFYVLGFYRE